MFFGQGDGPCFHCAGGQHDLADIETQNDSTVFTCFYPLVMTNIAMVYACENFMHPYLSNSQMEILPLLL